MDRILTLAQGHAYWTFIFVAVFVITAEKMWISPGKLRSRDDKIAWGQQKGEAEKPKKAD